MYNFHAPINSLSFGHCSISILKEFYTRNINTNIHLVQDPADISAYQLDNDFQFWLSSSAGRAKKSFKRTDKTFRLWHIDGAEKSVSNEQVLMTFHEVDAITPVEANFLKQQKAVLVSSKFSEEVFKSAGVDNVTYCPLGFDADHFKKLQFQKPKGAPITFSLFGKFEKRKHTEKAIRAWLKKYGNKPGHVLNLHVFNPFFSPEQNSQILMSIFGGQKPWNVNPIPYVKTLRELNEGLNACDIVIDMSGGEGFSIPSFSALALGKHGVVHNCSSIKDWAEQSGAVLVEPNGKEPVYDGIFFFPGRDFNQGNIFSFDEEAFLTACDTAVERFKQNPVNEKGLALPETYTWAKTTDTILEALK